MKIAIIRVTADPEKAEYIVDKLVQAIPCTDVKVAYADKLDDNGKQIYMINFFWLEV